MNHDKMKELVFAMHDGELFPADRSVAESHLASCAECRAALAEWRKTAAAMFPAEKPVASEAFVSAVMRRIETEPAAGFWGRLGGFMETLRTAFSLPRLALAGAAVLAVTVFFLSRPMKTASVPMTEAEVEFVSDLMEGPLQTAENGGAALGTTIEEYFL
ncbi:MAG TPA: hypothetical protein P5079_03595 [Elusimicrobiota bacterium]|nr:hypothetical protein [Elusimicrobiota bacterium]